MIVKVTVDGVVLEQVDDLTALHVAAPQDLDATAEVLRLSGFGRLADPVTALLDVGVLRSRASLGPIGPGWADRWQVMIDYAARKGWLSEDGRAVQAHVEVAPEV